MSSVQTASSSSDARLLREENLPAPFTKEQRKALRALYHQYMVGKEEWLSGFKAFLKKNSRMTASYQRHGDKISPKSEFFHDLMRFETFFQLFVTLHAECFPTLASLHHLRRRATSHFDCTIESPVAAPSRPKRIPPEVDLDLRRDIRGSYIEINPVSMKDYLTQLAPVERTVQVSCKKIVERLKTELPAPRLTQPFYVPSSLPVIELSKSNCKTRGLQAFDFTILIHRSGRKPPVRNTASPLEAFSAESRALRQVVVRSEPMGDFHSCVDPNYRSAGNFALFKLSEYGRSIYKKVMAVMPLQAFCEEKSTELKAELEDIKAVYKDICFTPFSPSVINHFIQYV